MKLGYQCQSWGPANFINSLKDISDLGYEGFETYSHIVPQYEDRLNVFKEIIEDLHLEMAAVHGRGVFTDPAPERIAEDIEFNMNTARFLEANECKTLVLSGAPKPAEKDKIETAWGVFFDVVGEIGERCSEMGIKVSFHPEPDSLIETRRDIDRVMKKIKAQHLGLCVDIGSLAVSGVNIINLLEDYKKRIHIVHLKDCKPRRIVDKKKNKRVNKITAGSKFAALGDGAIEFVKIIDTLHDIGYEDWAIVELDKPDKCAQESAETSINFARKHLGLIV